MRLCSDFTRRTLAVHFFMMEMARKLFVLILLYKILPMTILELLSATTWARSFSVIVNLDVWIVFFLMKFLARAGNKKGLSSLHGRHMPEK